METSKGWMTKNQSMDDDLMNKDGNQKEKESLTKIEKWVNDEIKEQTTKGWMDGWMDG